MKWLILPLLFMSGLAYGQRLVTVTPYVASTTVDSIDVTKGSTSFELDDAAVGDFAGVTAGMRVQGPLVPFGTTVSSNSGDTLLVLSAAATGSDTLTTLQFALEGDTVYADGQAFGMTFAISANRINSISVLDKSKQVTSIEVMFLHDYAYIVDGSAVALSDANASKAFNFRLLDDNQVFSSNHLMTTDRADVPIELTTSKDSDGQSRTFVQLVCTGADTVNSISDIVVNFVVE